MLLCVDGKAYLYFLQEFHFPARLLLRVRTCSYNNQSNSQNSLDIIETLKHTTEHSREKLDLEAAVWILPYSSTYSPNNLFTVWTHLSLLLGGCEPTSACFCFSCRRKLCVRRQQKDDWVSHIHFCPDMLLHGYPLRTFTARLKHHKREQAIKSVSVWEPTHRQRLRWDLHRNTPSTWQQKWEHVVFYLFNSWKSCSYSIAVTQNYFAVWNKAYSEGCAQDEGWVPALQANWTGNICCAESAADLQVPQ